MCACACACVRACACACACRVENVHFVAIENVYVVATDFIAKLRPGPTRRPGQGSVPGGDGELFG